MAAKKQPAGLKKEWDADYIVRVGKNFKYALCGYKGKNGESVGIIFTGMGAYYMTDNAATDKAWSKATIKDSFRGGRGMTTSFPLDIDNAYPVVRVDYNNPTEGGWVVVDKAVQRKGLEDYVQDILERLDDIVAYCALKEVQLIPN